MRGRSLISDDVWEKYRQVRVQILGVAGLAGCARFVSSIRAVASILAVLFEAAWSGRFSRPYLACE